MDKLKHQIPFAITPVMMEVCFEISKLLGKYEGLLKPKPQPELRRKNKIKTIQGSLAIEGNTLTSDQITAIINNKRVLGKQKEIIEVKNAIEVYDQASCFNPFKVTELLKAHGIMMRNLMVDAGKWRRENVGILKGPHVSHFVPKAQFVSGLMNNLFMFLKNDLTHHLVKSCVFHYELEFIHPFSDGNGRLGRLWQHVILIKNHPLYEYIPIESIIRKHQGEYYASLEKSDQTGNINYFIEFSLQTIIEAFREFFDEFKPEPHTVESRVDIAKAHFGKKDFKRKDYLNFFKTLSTATASRDLQWAVKNKILRRTHSQSLAEYRFLL